MTPTNKTNTKMILISSRRDKITNKNSMIKIITIKHKVSPQIIQTTNSSQINTLTRTRAKINNRAKIKNIAKTKGTKRKANNTKETTKATEGNLYIEYSSD